MKKQNLLKIVNSIMVLVFICLVTTALLDDVIPRDIYVKVHPLCGYIFTACVVCHVILNWTWIKTNIFKKA
jgi:hypothetical protein